jgi:hypothetical protein
VRRLAAGIDEQEPRDTGAGERSSERAVVGPSNELDWRVELERPEFRRSRHRADRTIGLSRACFAIVNTRRAADGCKFTEVS